MQVPPTVAFELGKEKRGRWDAGEVPRSPRAGGRPHSHAPWTAEIPSFLSYGHGCPWKPRSQSPRARGERGPRELAPALAPVSADRTRPELISEDIQRQFVQEVVQRQQALVSRQLEDFRSKKLMGMTPWEQELTQLGAWVGRDRASFEARERHLAERQLTHLEEMQ